MLVLLIAINLQQHGYWETNFCTLYFQKVINAENYLNS